MLKWLEAVARQGPSHYYGKRSDAKGRIAPHLKSKMEIQQGQR